MGHPAFEQRHALSDDYATWLIEQRAGELIGQFGFTESDRKDIEQELILDLLQRWKHFNPRRAKATTFISKVVENGVVALIAHRQAERRDYRRNAGELEPGLAERQAATPRVVADEQASVDLRLDVATVLSKLTPEQRELCELLKMKSIRSAARHLHMAEGTVRERVLEIRQHFRAAGLDESG